MTVESITLYTAKICPYAQRAELALEEAKAEYTKYQIDLQNKPEWYAPKVNPASKVPALAYGGPKVPADQPSPDSIKLAESLILVEFVADLFPNSSLLPKDPVQRARARFFIDSVSTKFIPVWSAVVFRGEPFEALFKAVEAIQSLLPDETKGQYAVGNEFTIADIAAAPFLARLLLSLKNDIGAYAEGEGSKAYETLRTDPKYARIKAYFKAIKDRESFKATFDEEYIKEHLSKRVSRK